MGLNITQANFSVVNTVSIDIFYHTRSITCERSGLWSMSMMVEIRVTADSCLRLK